jgi:hypothetical protein
MAKNFLYVNADGFREEAEGYEIADFINESTGVADAGKPIVLNAAGQLDSSFIDASQIDHGGLTGLGDDDHTQYILVDGTRAFTGDQSMGDFNLTDVADPTDATIDAASDDAVPMSFLASTASGEGASTIGVEDLAGYFVGDNIEDVLAELYAQIGGPTYTAGAGGVTKGDLVYVSGADTILPSTLSTNSWSVGLAIKDAAATEPVVVTGNDQVLDGVLTGATPGATQYWDGTGHTETIPSGSGSVVWKTGIAKNATDLHVEVELIKKNKAA